MAAISHFWLLLSTYNVTDPDLNVLCVKYTWNFEDSTKKLI